MMPFSEASKNDVKAINDCLSSVNYVTNKSLYSQNDEDGALLQTLECMGGHGKKEYLEFGTEDGTECNTRILREFYGWKGHLLDGSHENSNISLHKEFFTPSNIVSLLEKYQVSKDLDVLSVDTDYDDLWISREILLAGYKPRILITEYNVNFGSDWNVSTLPKPIGQETEVGWKSDCYFGASANALINLAQSFGYTPVFANFVNLIFVRLDQALELGMIIPSVARFPGPQLRALHRDCSGSTWKEIDLDTLKIKAADPNVSHTVFAQSFSDITLHSKTFETKNKKVYIFHK